MQPIRAIYTGGAHARKNCTVVNTITCRMDDDGFVQSFVHIILLEEENGVKYGKLKQVLFKDVIFMLSGDEERWLGKTLTE